MTVRQQTTVNSCCKPPIYITRLAGV